MDVSDHPLPFSVEILYCDHHDWLHEWLRHRLGSTADAADLAHDAFIRIMTSRRLPAHWGDEPRALLTHIAKGLLVDHWRRQEVERACLETLAHLPEQRMPSPETRLLIIEVLVCIDAMLANLSARTREIFVLSQFDGLTYPQIAKRCGLSLVTVKRHMRTAFAACLAVR
jgi:RNA polymerase sigma-70 factor (ECF subfamily)